MVFIVYSASIVVLQFRFTARRFLDELAVVWRFALCSSAISATKLSDFFWKHLPQSYLTFFFFLEAPASKLSDFFFFFFFFKHLPQSYLTFLKHLPQVMWLFWSTCLIVIWLFLKHLPQSYLTFFCSTLCCQEREVAWFIHPSTHDTGQVTNTGVPSGKLFLLHVQIRLFICWASFKIKRLCLIMNKNLVLSYACAHLCCWVCLKWRVCMPLRGILFETRFQARSKDKEILEEGGGAGPSS